MGQEPDWLGEKYKSPDHNAYVCQRFGFGGVLNRPVPKGRRHESVSHPLGRRFEGGAQQSLGV